MYIFNIYIQSYRPIKQARIQREALEQHVILSGTHTRALQLGRALPKKKSFFSSQRDHRLFVNFRKKTCQFQKIKKTFLQILFFLNVFTLPPPPNYIFNVFLFKKI